MGYTHKDITETERHPPKAHKTTHQNGGSDQVSIAGLEGVASDIQKSLVNRGNPSDWDFREWDLTKDETWRDLSLSSIVPAGAQGVILHVDCGSANVGNALLFRRKGDDNGYTRGGVDIHVANSTVRGDVFCGVDENRTIQYWASLPAWSWIAISVKGWWF